MRRIDSTHEERIEDLINIAIALLKQAELQCLIDTLDISPDIIAMMISTLGPSYDEGWIHGDDVFITLGAHRAVIKYNRRNQSLIVKSWEEGEPPPFDEMNTVFRFLV
jgi:hypothetical protein